MTLENINHKIVYKCFPLSEFRSLLNGFSYTVCFLHTYTT